jgi:Cu+-exporting ATPase
MEPHRPRDLRLGRSRRGVGTLVVDALGACLAAAGTLTPLLAAVVHVSSEMAFILNSARLVPVSSVKRHD